MLDEDGGVIRTTTAVAALVAALGDRLVADEVVVGAPSGEVRAGGAIARYDRVIVCAGRDTATPRRPRVPVRVSTHAVRVSGAHAGGVGLPPGRDAAPTATRCRATSATRSGSARATRRTTSPSDCPASSRALSRRERAG